MPAPVAIRSQYSDQFGSAQLPVLEELVKHEMEQHPSRREALAKVVTTNRDIWQSSEIHDMDLLQLVPEGQEYTFKRPKQGANKTLTVLKYGLGMSISEEMIDDGKFDMISEGVKRLGRSAKESQEIQFFSLFNNGFSGGSETTADGVTIFNSAHTLPSGSTYRNVLSTAADLSVTSLDQMLQDYETQFVGDSGIIYNMKPKYLVCHPSNKRYAMELVNSMNKPDTADNNMNSFKEDNLMVLSSPHLTDSDAWFLCGAPGDNGFRIIARKPVETKYAGADLGFTSDSMYVKVRYREIIGALYGYGVFGTPGA